MVDLVDFMGFHQGFNGDSMGFDGIFEGFLSHGGALIAGWFISWGIHLSMDGNWGAPISGNLQITKWYIQTPGESEGISKYHKRGVWCCGVKHMLRLDNPLSSNPNLWHSAVDGELTNKTGCILWYILRSPER